MYKGQQIKTLKDIFHFSSEKTTSIFDYPWDKKSFDDSEVIIKREVIKEDSRKDDDYRIPDNFTNTEISASDDSKVNGTYS